MKKLTIDEFITKAKLVHGDKYNYSDINWINSKSKITIGCKKHGNFLQLPTEHLYGKGCASCAGVKKLTLFEFIYKSNIIHNNIYNYSKFKYVNNHTKSIVDCKNHGEFFISPNNHLNGRGCPNCKSEKLRNYFIGNLSEFIKKSNNVHNFKYIYDEFIYVNSLTDSTIICNIHGKFNQSPGNHLSGQGCPICRLSKGELKIIKYLGDNNIKYIRQYTFSTCRNPQTNRKFRFDFYIPSKNILIEYDGQQHFSIGRLGSHIQTEKEFKYLQYKDTIKTKYAAHNNIGLIRIPYTELKNIDRILSAELC